MNGVNGRTLASVVFAMMVGGTTVPACFNSAGDCTLTYSCLEGISSGTAGGGGDTPAACVPSENSEPVADGCGVFVSSSRGKEGNGGAKDAPAKTLAAALSAIKTQGRAKRIYACAEEFAEAVEVPAGVAIYGGLDCAKGWAWVGATKKTTIAAGPDQVALTLRGGSGTTRIDDVIAKAADAASAGTSSIAVLVDGATAELTRSEMIAGNGADGAAGEAGAEPPAPGDPVPAAPSGTPGNDGANACGNVDGVPGPDAVLLGGAAAENTCATESSVGGKGGDGAIARGADGEAGVMGALGEPGLGEPATGSGWACVPGSGFANPGSPGGDGTAGPGASGLGALSSSAGYVGVSGSPGTGGKAGQGGGGGGGAKGLSNCGGGQAGAGASGGSGGAGGCGGKPGQGGGAGGASLALASVDATVRLTDCRLTAGKGGAGGVGGAAQPGGSGGNGGTGGTGTGLSQDACNGGKGGRGGVGGPGGGGLGGPSFALAFQGASVTKDTKTRLTPGTAGEGGPGGNDNAAMNVGASGTAAAEQELP